jgi:hypothetical protein
VSPFLQDVDDMILVLGKNLGKAIAVLNVIIVLPIFALLILGKAGSIYDVGAQI